MSGEVVYRGTAECRSCGRTPTERFEGPTFVADLCAECFLPDADNPRFVRVSRSFLNLHGVLSHAAGVEDAAMERVSEGPDA